MGNFTKLASLNDRPPAPRRPGAWVDRRSRSVPSWVVPLVPQFAVDWYNTPHGKRMFRYTMVSVVAVPVGLLFDILALDLLRWSPGWSGVFGAAFGAIPSYYLNRTWAWGKTGRSHLLKEIVPFWVIAVIGVIFAGWTQNLAGDYVAHHHITGLVRQVLILGAYLGGFAILWGVKYVIFNKLLFVVKHDDAPTAA
jgi:putative flippase GtrA